MAGRTREPGPTSTRTAENLRRIRQEQGLSYAELARRLAGIGHPILDTGLLKIEKGDRRVDVDDLVALAVALETTPNRLLLPAVNVEHASDMHELTPAIRETPLSLWAWATGEVPLGHMPSKAVTDRATRSEEVAFGRENRPHYWEQPAAPSTGQPWRAWVPIAASAVEAFRGGASTAEIRTVTEGAIIASLAAPDPRQVSVVFNPQDGHVTLSVEVDSAADLDTWAGTLATSVGTADPLPEASEDDVGRGSES